ncbi:MAG TPA: DUF929 family protein [Acidimicrobiales bacterium]|nr:DUF929 family protein [Acidimicrobiales bacterium]
MVLSPHEPVAAPAVHAIPRRYVALGLIIVATILVAVLVLIRNDNGADQTPSGEIFTPAPTSLLQTIGHIPTATVDAVGVTATAGPISPPLPTNNPALWVASPRGVANLPVVFFYGAEFAPYAAAESWPVVVALSRFGTFTQLGLAQSGSSVAFSDTSTFTFWQARYTSLWLDLQTVERYGSLDPTGGGYTALQTPTARQAASVEAYDTSKSTFPLLDVANHYTLIGSAFAPSVLDGLSQSDIVADLAFPASPVTQAVVGAANEITAAICTVTGQRPAAVCDTRGVAAADAKMAISRPAAS